MPVFDFGKAFDIAQDAKVFLKKMLPKLESYTTHGTAPEEAERLKNIVKGQRKTLKSQRREIEEQAENLKSARLHIKEQKKMLNSKDREIFRLKNELRDVKERVESLTDGRPAPRGAGESDTGALPDFVIIGAAKCGTTSLYDLLTRHPHIERAASKEPRYFSNNFDKGIEWYRSQFPPSKWRDGRRTITGEASPGYLFKPLAPERMAKVVPQARLIALLRNPVGRAFSHYQHMTRIVRETRSFEDVIEEASSEYLERGIYVDQLMRWSKFFSEEQMLVLKSEDFFEREAETLKRVLDFLGLPDWQPETWEIRNEGRYEQEMDPVTRRWLEEYFEPHNRRLYEYLGVDFGW